MSIRACAFGPLGSGKTLSAVKEAYRYMCNHPDRPIYSNVPLNPDIFKNYHPIISVKQLFRIDHPCFILLDEAWHLADSRSIQSPGNKALGAILLRSRKLGWVVVFTEQWFTQLDLRLRFVTDLWILPQFHVACGVLQEDIYDLHANFIATRYYDGRKFFDLYETNKDPTTLDIEALEIEFDRKTNR